MAIIKITHKKQAYFFDYQGGYIRLEDHENGKIGTLGYQICEGGKLTGATLSADNLEHAKKICRSWVVKHAKLNEF
jgi:hypothetical protein